eukprot:COSAG01_NODE_24537_length_775_cov_2.309172_1_plen_67_part_10
MCDVGFYSPCRLWPTSAGPLGVRKQPASARGGRRARTRPADQVMTLLLLQLVLGQLYGAEKSPQQLA